MQKLIPLLIFPILVTCFGPAIKVVPEFSGTGEKMTLMIAPILDDIEVDYDGNVKEEFGDGDKDTLILRYFKEKLPEFLTSVATFESIRWGAFDPVVQLTEQRVASTIQENLPLPSNDEGLKFTNVNKQPEFVMFIRDLKIEKGFESSSGAGGMS